MRQTPANPRSAAAPNAGALRPVAGQDYPKNLREFLAWFPDDQACRRSAEQEQQFLNPSISEMS